MRAITSIALLVIVCALANPAAAQESSPAETEAPAAGNMERVELNTADEAALETLPGIGPRTAELIIEYRSRNGGFEKIEDLMNVRGIGERTFLRLRELVRVDTDAGQK